MRRMGCMIPVQTKMVVIICANHLSFIKQKSFSVSTSINPYLNSFIQWQQIVLNSDELICAHSPHYPPDAVVCIHFTYHLSFLCCHDCARGTDDNPGKLSLLSPTKFQLLWHENMHINLPITFTSSWNKQRPVWQQRHVLSGDVLNITCSHS